MPLVSPSEFADLCKVTRQAVGEWIRTKRITPPAVIGEGRARRIDVELAQKQIRARRDISQALGNGSKTRLNYRPSAEPEQLPQRYPFACLERCKDNPADFGVKLVGLQLIHRVGAEAAVLAAQLGAPMKTAYALKDAMTISMMQTFEALLEDLGLPSDQALYEPDKLADVDWKWLAKEAGERVDLDAWKTWKAQRLSSNEENRL